MSDEQLSALLGSLPRGKPSKEFEERLLLEIDKAADEYSALHQEFVTLEPVHADASRRSRMWRRTLAGVAVCAALAGALLIADRDNGDEVVAADGQELVTVLLSAAEDDDLTTEQRLAYLVEAAAIDDTGRALAVLGPALASEGFLRLGAAEVGAIESVSFSQDGSTVVITADGLDGDGVHVDGGARVTTWTTASGDVLELDLGDVDVAAATFAMDGTLVTWTPPAQRRGFSIDGQVEQVAAGPVVLRRSNQANSHVVASTEAELQLLDPNGDVIAVVDLDRNQFRTRVTPEGSLVVAERIPAVGEPESVVFWEPRRSPSITTDHPLAAFALRTTDLLDFSGDGRLVAVAERDRILVLDARSYGTLETVAVADATRVDFIGMSDALLVHSPGALSLWDLRSQPRQLVSVAVDPRSGLASGVGLRPVFSAAALSGRVAAVSAKDPHVVELWSLDPSTWVELGCAHSVALSDEERAELGLLAVPHPCPD